jgi:hypothetical protein
MQKTKVHKTLPKYHAIKSFWYCCHGKLTSKKPSMTHKVDDRLAVNCKSIKRHTQLCWNGLLLIWWCCCEKSHLAYFSYMILESKTFKQRRINPVSFLLRIPKIKTNKPRKFLVSGNNPWGHCIHKISEELDHHHHHLHTILICKWCMSRLPRDLDLDREEENFGQCPSFAKIIWAMPFS